VVSYEDLARHIQAPRAARAVANAVARNPVAWLIPCHRVIRKSGALGGYRWGETRKKALLAWEAVTAEDVRSSEG
jgi:AraC family transcriptional regulator of adaptative response/methylated-DNA-[protein]-cysteine methyltransferase